MCSPEKTFQGGFIDGKKAKLNSLCKLLIHQCALKSNKHRDGKMDVRRTSSHNESFAYVSRPKGSYKEECECVAMRIPCASP